MRKSVEVVYEGGLLRPLEPLALEERQQVSIVLEAGPQRSIDFHDPSVYFTADEWAEAKQDRLSLKDLRRSLESLRLSDAVIEARLNEPF